MKKVFQICVLFLIGGFLVSCGEASKTTENTQKTDSIPAAPQPAPAETYTVDATKAEVMWLGTKTGGAHYGFFTLSSGSFKLSEAGIEGGEAVINVASLTVIDALPDKEKGKLAGHLTSEDFFNTAKFPDATITVTGSTKYSGAGETKPEGLPDAVAKYFVAAPTHTINAKFKVKGEEKDLSFPAQVSKNEDGSITLMSLVTFNRADYGLRFMSDTEAKVNPEIRVGIMLTATK